ncbi:hypothetical protein BDF22DRAFT_617566, partial [Syncephalis plumigaleata]
LSAQLENVALLQLSDSFEFYFKETYAMPNSRSEAHLVMRCKFCTRDNSATFVGNTRDYSGEKSGEFQTLAELDCRGLEPVEFEPRVRWIYVQANSGVRYDDVDLTEKEWVEYDEKVGQMEGRHSSLP